MLLLLRLLIDSGNTVVKFNGSKSILFLFIYYFSYFTKILFLVNIRPNMILQKNHVDKCGCCSVF